MEWHEDPSRKALDNDETPDKNAGDEVNVDEYGQEVPD